MTGASPEPAESSESPRSRPRHALAAPGEISRRQIKRHARALRGTPTRPETPAQRTTREGRRADVNAAMDSLRAEGSPAGQRSHGDLRAILDRISGQDLARFTTPLVGTLGHRPVEPEAAPTVDPGRAAEALALEKAEEQERRRRAAELARRRKGEQRARRQREAERQRRASAEQKARQAEEAARHRQEREERRRREAEVAAERARVQAERRAREEAEAAERERRRAEAEHARLLAEEERRRHAARVEAERLRREAEERERARQEAAAAEEAECRRRRAEEERLRREAEEARRHWIERARRYAGHSADRALSQARLLADRERHLGDQQALEEASRLRAHQDRESQALYRAARELEGPEIIPVASQRPFLAHPDEDVTDEELFARARVALPEWRRRDRLSTKAEAIRSAAAPAPAPDGPTTAAIPLIPSYTAPLGAPEPRRAATAKDRRRQAGLTLAWLVFVLAGAWGLGLFGRLPGLDALDFGSYRAAHDGRYGFTTTVFSLYPLHPLVWPGLWAAVGVHVLHQWAPGQAASSRQREVGWPLAGALLAVSTWFPLAVLVPWGLEVLVWLVALALMVRVIRRLTDRPARTGAERVVTDGAAGLLAGVLLAGLPTTLGSALNAWGVALPWFPTELFATLLLLAVLVLGLHLALTDRGRMGVALGMGWTLLNLGLPRLLPPPLGAEQSAWVGLTAVFGALALVLAVAVRRSWVRQVERDAGLTP